MSCPSIYDNTVVLGERCSGTNFVQTMFGNRQNRYWCVDGVEVHMRHIHDAPFCWKHGNALQTIPPYSRFAQTQFVVIVRNPYDWVRSLFSWQHQMQRRRTMMDFITMPVIPIVLPSSSGWAQTLRNDVDFAGTYYRNPLHMRTVKYLAWLRLKHRVNCVKYIQFETVSRNVSIFVHEFNLNVTGAHKRRQSPTRKRQTKLISTYPGLTERETSSINERLDVHLEHRLGYSLIVR